MDETGTRPPAGWYPDPAADGGERYWDGTDWTAAHGKLPIDDPTIRSERALGEVVPGTPRPSAQVESEPAAPEGVLRPRGRAAATTALMIVAGAVIGTGGAALVFLLGGAEADPR